MHSTCQTLTPTVIFTWRSNSAIYAWAINLDIGKVQSFAQFGISYCGQISKAVNVNITVKYQFT